MYLYIYIDIDIDIDMDRVFLNRYPTNDGSQVPWDQISNVPGMINGLVLLEKSSNRTPVGF